TFTATNRSRCGAPRLVTCTPNTASGPDGSTRARHRCGSCRMTRSFHWNEPKSSVSPPGPATCAAAPFARKSRSKLASAQSVPAGSNPNPTKARKNMTTDLRLTYEVKQNFGSSSKMFTAKVVYMGDDDRPLLPTDSTWDRDTQLAPLDG